MASYTPNVNLKKPADGDAYDIADANGNMDAIDTAIGSLRESVSQIGDRKISDLSSSQPIANSTSTALGSISLEAGVWIVVANAWFASNSTGHRYVRLSDVSGNANAGEGCSSSSAMASGNLSLCAVRTFDLSSTTSIYLNVWQNSGIMLNCGGFITAVRVK